MKSQKSKTLKYIFQLTIALLVGCIASIFLKVFCFALFKVPSGSMEPTLLVGDYILVNKQVPGPRIFKDWMFFRTGNWEMKRLKSWGSIKRNDVLVFNFPYSNDDYSHIAMDFNLHLVKRCIGMPGDTLYIEKGFNKVKSCTDTLGLYSNQLKLSNCADSTLDGFILSCMLYDSVHRWTIKKIGPIYIPKAHDSLRIDNKNIELYRKLITYETGKTITVKGDLMMLGSEALTSYVFTQNYYFMAGDNVFGSQDSRYWGLLPEDHIIGKVAIILKSKNEDTGKYRWDRFLKVL